MKLSIVRSGPNSTEPSEIATCFLCFNQEVRFTFIFGGYLIGAGAGTGCCWGTFAAELD